jgi:hypothetical protein
MTPISLRPDYSAARTRAGTPLIRAACALLASQVYGHLSASSYLAGNWPRDEAAQTILKAAVSPASTSSSTALSMTVISDFLLGLGPASAGAALLERGLRLQFASHAAIFVPNLLSAAANTGFVQEGSPVPVRQFALDGVTLTPRKLAVLTVFNRELFQHSTPTVESLVGDAITRSASLSFDAALLDSTAGDATRPAGLRNGIAPIGTASTATPRTEAMMADVATLTGTVSAVAGNSPIALVCAPPQATAMRMWARRDSGFEIFSTSGLADGTACAVATDALAFATDPQPRLEIGSEGALHMDSTPSAISTAGTPNTVAAPVRSLWQTDSISLRMIFECSWALRAAGGLAWLQSTNW